MSEDFQEWIGDAGDALEFFSADEVKNEVAEETKTQSSNVEKDGTPTKGKTPPPKAKPQTKNNGQTKTPPVADDLLQALCVGAIFTPSIQNEAKCGTNTKQHTKKLTTDCKSSKVMPEKNKESGVKLAKDTSNSNKSDSGLLKSQSKDQNTKGKRYSEVSQSTDEKSGIKTLDKAAPSDLQKNRSNVGETKSRSVEEKKCSENATKVHKNVSVEKIDSAVQKNGPEKQKSSKSTDLLHRNTAHAKYKSPGSNSSKIEPSSEKQEVDCLEEEETETPGFSEEDLKNIDLYLVDQMVNNLIRQKTPARSQEARYQVRVSPLEISDLAEAAVQNLIQELPKMSIIFKRQIGKFKKKKGYAEIDFTKVGEVKDFVKKLIPIKLMESKIEITITAWLSGIPQILSFHLSSTKTLGLMSLINGAHDPQAKAPDGRFEKLQLESVPSTVTVPLIECMFPFCTFVRINRNPARHSEKSFTGPVVVQYNHHAWLEAMMECFSDFCIDGHHLTLEYQGRNQDFRGAKEKNEKDQSIRESQKDKNVATFSTFKPRDDKEMRQPNDATWNEEIEDYEDDDAISNMTRDVCAGMLESLDMLKQLDANNPNIERILKMREQLDYLQKSLDPQKGKKQSTNIGGKERHGNPWKTCDDDVNSKSKEHDTIIVKSNRNEASGESKRQRRNSASNDRLDTDTSSHMQNKKRRKMNEQMRREEEQQQRQAEEARKEAESKRLIQKIEEARLKDWKKAEASVQHRSVWDWESHKERRKESPFSPKKSAPEIHPTVSGSRDHGLDRGSNRFNKRLFEESQTTQDDGVDQRLAEFERELAVKGAIQPHPSPTKRSKTIGSECPLARDSSAGVPILREDEYQNIIAEGRFHVLPQDYCVRIQSSLNRQCPVKGCPDTKYYRDVDSFTEHWSIFHVPETTMRFCHKCTAYFMSTDELAMHLEKHHWINQNEAEFMVRKARIKVISNPSYRDPKPYLAPLC